jgi:hypothetical protein
VKKTTDRLHNAKIFFLSDSTEAGTGSCTKQFSIPPYTLSRSGITTLGPFGVGIFGTVTSAVTSQTADIPGSIELRQNYPNPFNPTTTIFYALPKQSKVMVEVFDMLGRKVATLVVETKSSGEYSVQFDASKYASGVYIYKMSTSTVMIAKKMLIVK